MYFSVTFDVNFPIAGLFKILGLFSWAKDLQTPEVSTRWFKYDRDWFVCKQAALRNSCATLREWSYNLHPPSCSG